MNNIPEGFKLVPVEPTEEMIEAADVAARFGGCDLYGLKLEMRNGYRAALAAAPEAPAPVDSNPVAYRYKEGRAASENEKPWKPTTLAHGEALLSRKALSENGTLKGQERDWHLALTVEPLYTQTAPADAQPVGYIQSGGSERFLCKELFDPLNGYTVPVYTHPDAGEVARLRAELKSMGERYQKDLLLSRERWCYGNRADKTIEALRAQLSERDALLRTCASDFSGIGSFLTAFHAENESQWCDHLDDALGGARFRHKEIISALSATQEGKGHEQ